MSPYDQLFDLDQINDDFAQTDAVLVLKRSMNPGFAGIENDLFVHERTMMVFGDAKQTLTRISAALKEGG